MIYDLIFFYRKIKEDDIWGSSASLSFYLLLAFFPFVIALVAMLSLVPLDAEQVMTVMEHILPGNVFTLLRQNAYLLEQGRTGVVSAGFISAVWISSKAIKALMKAFNKSYSTFDKRPFWQKYVVSIIITLVLAAGIIVSVFLYFFGNNILSVIKPPEQITVALTYARSIFLYVAMTAVMAIIFKVLPDKKLKIRSVIPGALATGIIWVVATIGFGIFMDINGSFDNFYGTMGSVIALMVWLYLISFSMLFGNAINSYRLESDNYE